MSIGFTFTGKVKKPEALVASAKKLAEERRYGLSSWDPMKENALNISLCPLGGLIQMSWRKEGGLFGQWAVEGCCYSTPAGPGLHKAAVEALDALPIQKLSVADETEYYQHRDFDRMLREHFYPWLRCPAKRFRRGTVPRCACAGTWTPTCPRTSPARWSLRWAASPPSG